MFSSATPNVFAPGEVRLELPPHFDTNRIVKTNKDMIEQAESLVYKWNGEIREALERELKKVRRNGSS